MPDDLSARLADRLKSLRHSQGWSLDQLAAKSDVSRATLSRIEKAEVSPTAVVLGRLCAVFDMTMSRLLMAVEDGFAAHVPFGEQPEWTDPETGLSCRVVSPPDAALTAEVQECHLPPGALAGIDASTQAGRECYLVLLDGAMTVTLGDVTHQLSAGDCLRYRQTRPAQLETGARRGARFTLIYV